MRRLMYLRSDEKAGSGTLPRQALMVDLDLGNFTVGVSFMRLGAIYQGNLVAGPLLVTYSRVLRKLPLQYLIDILEDRPVE